MTTPPTPPGAVELPAPAGQNPIPRLFDGYWTHAQMIDYGRASAAREQARTVALIREHVISSDDGGWEDCRCGWIADRETGADHLVDLIERGDCV